MYVYWSCIKYILLYDYELNIMMINIKLLYINNDEFDKLKYIS